VSALSKLDEVNVKILVRIAGATLVFVLTGCGLKFAKQATQNMNSHQSEGIPRDRVFLYNYVPGSIPLTSLVGQVVFFEPGDDGQCNTRTSAAVTGRQFVTDRQRIATEDVTNQVYRHFGTAGYLSQVGFPIGDVSLGGETAAEVVFTDISRANIENENVSWDELSNAIESAVDNGVMGGRRMCDVMFVTTATMSLMSSRWYQRVEGRTSVSAAVVNTNVGAYRATESSASRAYYSLHGPFVVDALTLRAPAVARKLSAYIHLSRRQTTVSMDGIVAELARMERLTPSQQQQQQQQLQQQRQQMLDGARQQQQQVQQQM
jgi:hypothetical protein